MKNKKSAWERGWKEEKKRGEAMVGSEALLALKKEKGGRECLKQRSRRRRPGRRRAAGRGHIGRAAPVRRGGGGKGYTIGDVTDEDLQRRRH